jgi:hypothetical protein
MNIASNPWSFTSADVVSSAISAISLNSDGTVSVTVGATAGIVAGNFVTVASNSTAVYNGFYLVAIVVSGTVLTLVPSLANPPRIPAGTGAGGANGFVILNQYKDWIRAEDIKWDMVPVSATLDVRDRNGNIVWQATSPANAGANPPNYNRGKVFWINGLSINILTAASILTITVN